MDLHCTREHFVMHSASCTTGFHLTFPESVYVVSPSCTLLYPTGGVTISRYNEVHGLMAGLLTDVCHNVCIEPRLQPLSSETTTRSTTTEGNSRLGFTASCLCGGRFERALFNVKVLNPFAHSTQTPQI